MKKSDAVWCHLLVIVGSLQSPPSEGAQTAVLPGEKQLFILLILKGDSNTWLNRFDVGQTGWTMTLLFSPDKLSVCWY